MTSADENYWIPNPGYKVKPPSNYPPEEGRYLRGNDLSPAALCVILKWPQEEIPKPIEHLVRVGVESGAALAGTLQTENIGIEKIICNIVANPNIRYLIVCGPESPGHLVGQSLVALSLNGIGEDHRIIGSKSPTPYLYNISLEAIEQFRKQVKIINLINEGNENVIAKAIWSCYQEEPTQFGEHVLFDPGAFPKEAISSSITWRVKQPWYAPRNENEWAAIEQLERLIAEIKAKQEAKKREYT
ncbi:MAG: tetrahydromethanopterin S-methyltransferase subunit A [Armatimonadetes bacterium]|nr:tetrahydromethanopterin S-methyltransferase subunit A [Armatimonadota bacterium]